MKICSTFYSTQKKFYCQIHTCFNLHVYCTYCRFSWFSQRNQLLHTTPSNPTIAFFLLSFEAFRNVSVSYTGTLHCFPPPFLSPTMKIKLYLYIWLVLIFFGKVLPLTSNITVEKVVAIQLLLKFLWGIVIVFRTKLNINQNLFWGQPEWPFTLVVLSQNSSHLLNWPQMGSGSSLTKMLIFVGLTPTQNQALKSNLIKDTGTSPLTHHWSYRRSLTRTHHHQGSTPFAFTQEIV